jgi:aspartate kinase
MAGVTGMVPLVLKFGGSSFPSPSAYADVARYITERLSMPVSAGAVVVVSAMSGTTGRLTEALGEVSPSASARVTAAMTTTGETVSAALMTAALNAVGMPADLVPGWRTGITAGGPAEHSGLLSIHPDRLRESVAEFGIAVLAGGQAVDEHGNKVMLGRNSSDLSAVAAAIAVSTRVCELFSDVPGVCTADPRVVPEAQSLTRVNYDMMRLMSASGAKVVHWSAVDLAATHHVELHCRSMMPEGLLRTVVGDGPMSGAVIVADRCAVWRMDKAGYAELLIARLATDRYLAFALAHEGHSHLVTDAPLDWDEGGIAGRGGVLRPELCAMTTLHQDGRIERELLPKATAGAAARKAHREMYPEPETLAVIEPKAYSANSGLLTNGPTPAGVE